MECYQLTYLSLGSSVSLGRYWPRRGSRGSSGYFAVLAHTLRIYISKADCHRIPVVALTKMNFYFEAAKVLDRLDAKQGSIKGVIATVPEKDRRRTAALVIETLKCKGLRHILVVPADSFSVRQDRTLRCYHRGKFAERGAENHVVKLGTRPRA